MDLYSVEAVALRGPWRVCMIATEIPNTFLESPDIFLSLVPDPNWYFKVDQISPTLVKGLRKEELLDLEEAFKKQCYREGICQNKTILLLPVDYFLVCANVQKVI